ncbi:NAD-dependent epimerase/dehydratase family protein [Kitasatospora sp. NPDC101155]|uniref:NAD-dependent epimerase/dehydratase family protein n=1 Tax=Kitasatospora sp. NPDC101155 TaxID=3364097 RepID=UPI0037F81BE9
MTSPGRWPPPRTGSPDAFRSPWACSPWSGPPPRSSSILVTGATGTVGRALADQLTALGAPVRAATRRPVAVSPEMADAITALRAASLEPFTATVTPTVEQLTGRPAATFRAWAGRHRKEFGHG